MARIIDFFDLIQYKKMNKNLLLIFIAITSAITLATFNQSSTTLDEFELWKLKFGTPFQHSQDVFRRIIFYQNLYKITQHNQDPTQTYKMAVNQFTIYTHQQFKARYLSTLKPYSELPTSIDESYQGPNVEIDWTTKGAVSGIKNQGQCGSCWAFSAIASTQSYALLNNKYVSLSEQQLVDCSDLYGNAGCNGGWAERGLKYIKDKGISTEVQYPYKAVTQKCQKHGGSFKINSVTSVLECRGLESAIMERPISVSVDAVNWGHYSSGVFSNCGQKTDHAVLLVGVVGGAWKIKNSWGRSWGENGFIRLAGGNTCGICVWGASYPH